MEHEDNANLDNFVQKSSNLLETNQPGCVGSGGTVGEEFIAVGMGDNNGGGGKFEEQEEDGEYIKYIKEVQQSEKHKLSNEQDDVCGDHYDRIGNGNGQVEQEKRISNDFDEIEAKFSAVVTATDFIKTGLEEEDKRRKTDKRDEYDFSAASNTYSSVADHEIDLQGMNTPESSNDVIREIQQEKEQDQPTLIRSDLAVENSNGTNIFAPISPYVGSYEACDNKENRNPQGIHLDLQQLEGNEDDHQASPLNPDAMIFVPRLGANQALPSSPGATHDIPVRELDVVSIDIGTDEPVVPHPSVLPRHLVEVDDDFVAQSPRKGARVYNMDAISLPGESEFDHGADCRPHELYENNGTENGTNNSTDDVVAKTSDTTNFEMGPETSVDEDIEGLSINATAVDVSNKHSICMDDIFNTVQPLPVEGDCLNESFSENRLPKSRREEESETLADKELLNVEEKEYVSHSPSTEEIQILHNFHINSSQKDMSLVPIGMDSVTMQDSFYAEHTSFEAQQLYRASGHEEALFMSLADTTISLENSLNSSTVGPAGGASKIAFNLLETDEAVYSTSPSPCSPVPEEEQLIKESAEHCAGKTMDNETKTFINMRSNEDIEDLGKRMDALNLLNDDGELYQVNQTGVNTTSVVIDKVDPVLNTTDITLKFEKELDKKTNKFETQHLSMDSDEKLPFQNDNKIEAFIEPVMSTFFDLKPAEPLEQREDASVPVNKAYKSDEVQEETQNLTCNEKFESNKMGVNNKDAVETLKTTSNVLNKSSKKVEQATVVKASTTTKTLALAKPKTSDVGSKKTTSDLKKPNTTSTKTTTTTSRKTTPVVKTSTANKPITTSSITARKPAGPPTLGNKSLVTASTASRGSTTATKPCAITSTVRSTSRLSTMTAVPKQRSVTTSAKPTTLGVSAAGIKPNIISPRSTLSSQLRRATPVTSVSTTSKSPVKVLSSAVTGKTTSTTSARLKTTGGNTVITTKPFSARPTQKPTPSTSAPTSFTARRLPVTKSFCTTSGNTTTNAMKRSPLSKPKTIAVVTASCTGKLKNDRSTGTAANKTKEFSGKKDMVAPGGATKKRISSATEAQTQEINGFGVKLDDKELEQLQPTQALQKTTDEKATELVEQQKNIDISF